MAYGTYACFEVVWDVKSWRTKTFITAGRVDAIMTATSAIQRSTLVHVCMQQNRNISVTRTRTETEITLQHTVPNFGPELNKLQFNFISYLKYLLDTWEVELSWPWQLLWSRLSSTYPAGQLHTGPSGESSHRRSHPPLFTPHDAATKLYVTQHLRSKDRPGADHPRTSPPPRSRGERG